MLDIWMSGIARAGGIETQLEQLPPRSNPVRPAARDTAPSRVDRATAYLGHRLIQLGQRLAGQCATTALKHPPHAAV